jgi:hypothetical protein
LLEQLHNRKGNIVNFHLDVRKTQFHVQEHAMARMAVGME